MLRQPIFAAALATVVLLAVATSADTLTVYRKTGINGGPPIHTLYVFSDGRVKLITDNLSTRDSVSDSLSTAALQQLVSLFTANGYALLDTTYFSGCLSCPEFSVDYGGKQVRGNTSGSSDSLRAILAGLDALVNQLLALPVTVLPRQDNARPASGPHLAALRVAVSARSAAQCAIAAGAGGSAAVWDLGGRLLLGAQGGRIAAGNGPHR
jgi:hypothetical protein